MGFRHDYVRSGSSDNDDDDGEVNAFPNDNDNNRDGGAFDDFDDLVMDDDNNGDEGGHDGVANDRDDGIGNAERHNGGRDIARNGKGFRGDDDDDNDDDGKDDDDDGEGEGKEGRGPKSFSHIDPKALSSSSALHDALPISSQGLPLVISGSP